MPCGKLLFQGMPRGLIGNFTRMIVNLMQIGWLHCGVEKKKKTEIGKLALSFPVRGHRRIEDSTINCISTMNSLARVYLAAFGCNGYLTLLLDLDSTFALLIILYLYSSGSGVPTLYYLVHHRCSPFLEVFIFFHPFRPYLWLRLWYACAAAAGWLSATI